MSGSRGKGGPDEEGGPLDPDRFVKWFFFMQRADNLSDLIVICFFYG